MSSTSRLGSTVAWPSPGTRARTGISTSLQRRAKATRESGGRMSGSNTRRLGVSSWGIVSITSGSWEKERMNPSFSRGLKLGLSSGEVRSIIRLLGGTGLVATPRVQMSEWYFMRALLSSLPSTRTASNWAAGAPAHAVDCMPWDWQPSTAGREADDLAIRAGNRRGLG